MKLLTTADTRLATMLAEPADEVRIAPTWWSWSGAHGGLAVALVTTALRRAVGDAGPLRSVSAQLLAPVTDAVRLEADVLRRGRSVVTASGVARQDGRPHVVATTVFGRPGRGPAAVGPLPPPSPHPEELERFRPPAEVLPFSTHTDIRPVGDARPFAGGDTAELIAWVRLTDDDQPVDEVRLVLLFDCLAPSIAAVLPAMTAVPTVELGVQLSPAVAAAISPWVLLRSRTELAGDDGWCSERLDAWAPDGTHLGMAHQLRLVLG
jgi:acyl-CoA thioesterase